MHAILRVPSEPVAEAEDMDGLFATHHRFSVALVVVCNMANDALKIELYLVESKTNEMR